MTAMAPAPTEACCLRVGPSSSSMYAVRGHSFREPDRIGPVSRHATEEPPCPSGLDEYFASARVACRARNNAPLTGERAATRGRSATDGADAPAGVKRASSQSPARSRPSATNVKPERPRANAPHRKRHGLHF